MSEGTNILSEQWWVYTALELVTTLGNISIIGELIKMQIPGKEGSGAVLG